MCPRTATALIITDAAVNIAPTLEDKIDIVQNAIDLAHALGMQEVRVAILSAMETVNPKVPSTIEAGALCKMADRGQITGGILDGPLALDNAISLRAAQIKKIDSPVAGRANVLVVPDLEAGNMLAKSLSFLAGRGRRRHRARRARADHPDQPRRFGVRPARLLRGRGAGRQARREDRPRPSGERHGRRHPRAQRRLVEHQVLAVPMLPDAARALVCAGRSKASTRRRTSSRRTRQGTSLDEQPWDEGTQLGHDGALDHLVDFLRAASGRPSPDRRRPSRRARRPRTSREPALVDAPSARAAREIRSARAAAPAAQPGADPRRRRAHAGSAAGRVLRHRVSPRAARAGADVRAAGGNHRRVACAATAFTACPTSTSPAYCRESTRRRRAGRTVVAHLGNGASMCAIRAGRSVASTMGFTAVDGLPMGTRCGTLDPGVMLYLMDELKMDARAIEKLIYQQSGLLGVSGISSDMRALLASDDPRAKLRGRPVRLSDRPRARLAGGGAAAGSTRSCSRAASASMRAAIRERVCNDAAWLGVDFDAAANAGTGRASARRQAAFRRG